MFKLCIFDLDQTLVDTDDMTKLRESGVRDSTPAYVLSVEKAFQSRDRHLFTLQHLNELRKANPKLKLGIFTRAPKSYTDTLLRIAYPKFTWDTVIAYEDVKRRKPNREGIYRAMIAVGLDKQEFLPEVLFVGDGDVDIRAAYHAGCYVALFTGGWPNHREKTHWRSLELLPDASFADPEDLRKVIADPNAFLPALEHALTAPQTRPQRARFDKINKFFDWDDGDRRPHPIHAMGRSFAGYESLNERRGWHRLSMSIQENKDSKTFPDEWIDTIKRFMASHYAMQSWLSKNRVLTVTVIPPRPARMARLTHLLEQLENSFEEPALGKLKLRFDPNVLAYRDGVKSHSREHLDPKARFANVRDHLYVVDPSSVKGGMFLIIDDVSTTGATLLYAERYLNAAGATSVDCLTIAMNITDPVRRE